MQVLIVDDETYMLDYLKEMIDWQSYGFDRVLTVSSGSLARDLIARGTPDLLITDIRMPKVSGLDLCRYISEQKLPTKVILLSGYGEFEYAQQAIQYGVSEYLVKPVLREQLDEVLEKMISRYFTGRKNEGHESSDVIRTLCDYIRDHICEELSLETLARVVYLHPSYLSRYFRETTGRTLSSFITDCKMEKAAELLSAGNAKVNEVMKQLGYQKSQYFSSLFKEKFGVTPNDFRRGRMN